MSLTPDYQKAFEQWAAQRELTHPRPVAPSRWEGWLTLRTSSAILVAISAAMLGGFRTASSVASLSMLGEFGWVEGLAAFVAVELSIALYTAEAERERRNSSRFSEWLTNNLGLGSVTLGIIVAFIISSVANTDVAFSGIGLPLWEDIRGMAVGLALGLGVPVLVYVAGRILGRAAIAVGKDRDKAQRNYKKEEAAWIEARRRSWAGSKGRILRGDDATPLSEPRRTKRRKKEKKKYPCTQCDQVFDTTTEYAAHVRWDHPKEEADGI